MTIARASVARSTLSEMRLQASSARTNSAVPVERNATAVVTFAPCSKARRAATWFEPNTVAMTSSSAIPSQRGMGRPDKLLQRRPPAAIENRELQLSIGSVRLDAVVLHDLAPARQLLERPFLQLFGAAHHEVHAEALGERLAHVG